jgi:hypothetical protein
LGIALVIRVLPYVKLPELSEQEIQRKRSELVASIEKRLSKLGKYVMLTCLVCGIIFIMTLSISYHKDSDKINHRKDQRNARQNAVRCIHTNQSLDLCKTELDAVRTLDPDTYASFSRALKNNAPIQALKILEGY